MHEKSALYMLSHFVIVFSVELKKISIRGCVAQGQLYVEVRRKVHCSLCEIFTTSEAKV